ncbi:MAG: GNAT family N-acetyltransferase [Bacteroidaceae bacterium]|nr:GNAT family N-acetyltransferase [Bacteroidaceae bacterium]
MKNVPKLYTNRCVLDEICQEDGPFLHEIMENAESQRFLPELYSLVRTKEGMRLFVTCFKKYLIQNEGILWGIKLKKRLIGFIAIMDLSTRPALFYAIHPLYRNLGIMKECIAMVLKYIRKEIQCSAINTQIRDDNIISEKILLNFGFKSLTITKASLKDYQLSLYKDTHFY